VLVLVLLVPVVLLLGCGVEAVLLGCCSAALRLCGRE
jgi:hypothetical protein